MVCVGIERSVYSILVFRSEVKQPTGMPTRRWEDNVNWDLKEVGCNEKGFISLRLHPT